MRPALESAAWKIVPLILVLAWWWLLLEGAYWVVTGHWTPAR